MKLIIPIHTVFGPQLQTKIVKILKEMIKFKFKIKKAKQVEVNNQVSL